VVGGVGRVVGVGPASRVGGVTTVVGAGAANVYGVVPREPLYLNTKRRPNSLM
jgi:hypothetical protein